MRPIQAVYAGGSCATKWYNHETDMKNFSKAFEFVVGERLNHVLDHLKGTWGRDMELKDMRTVIDAMIEDVAREARGEIVDSRDARAAIGTRTAQMFKRRVTAVTL